MIKKTTFEQVKKMTGEQLQIKIAKLLGWKGICKGKAWANTLVGISPETTNGCFNPIPNYPGSLEEMYDAEEVVGKEPINVLRYYQNLVFIIDHDNEGNQIFGRCIYWDTLHATARQRAEAFVLTMEKE